MNKLICFVLSFAFLTSECKNQKNEKDSVVTTELKKDTLSNELPFEEFTVSLIRLIATPEKYDGKTITVVGYLNLEFEGDAIYLHKNDYEHSLTKNGFWVDFSKDIEKRDLNKYNKKYVIITGRFDMKSQGHMELFGGAIENITRLDIWIHNDSL